MATAPLLPLPPSHVPVVELLPPLRKGDLPRVRARPEWMLWFERVRAVTGAEGGPYQLTSEKNAAGGYLGLNASARFAATLIADGTIGDTEFQLLNGRSGTLIDTVNLLTQILAVDGAASGIDADKLDGQEGAYYRDAGNINAGTLAVARGGTGNTTLGTSKALQSGAGGLAEASAVTAVELGYVGGVTSGIQAQIDAVSGAGAVSVVELVTLGASGNTITFTPVANALYVLAILHAVVGTDNASILFRFNGDSTATAYDWYGAMGSTVDVDASDSEIELTLSVASAGIGSAANEIGGPYFVLFGALASTTLYKHLSWFGGHAISADGTVRNVAGHGKWKDASAVTSIFIGATTNNFTAGQAVLLKVALA